MGKSIFTVQRFFDESNKWVSYLEAMGVSKTYCDGFINAIKMYYPCPKLRIIKYDTHEVVKEIDKNGVVYVYNKRC